MLRLFGDETMLGFDDILSKYRTQSLSTSDFGTKFEELMSGFLQTYPIYDGLFDTIYLWRDFPYRDQFGKGHDVGIDIVAKTNGGEWWAVQCKMYDGSTTVSKKDIDSFMSASSKTFETSDGERIGFSNRLLIATTDNLGENTKAMMQNQFPPVSTLMYSVLRDAEVDWEALENNIHGKKARKPAHKLRPHQVEALNKALENYDSNDRGKLIMACGTGKTFTSLRIAEAMVERYNPGKRSCILFLAPSISLVGQTMREWMNNRETEITPICVCSDPKASKNDVTEDSTAYIEFPATTDPDRIIHQYNRVDNTVVIFSTYQSISSVIEAQHKGLPVFDLIVCDEAHRTTGAIKPSDGGSYYTDVHEESKIHGKKRLYMTATPRIYGEYGKAKAEIQSVVLYSMDDENIYGKEFYRYSFGTAVDEDMLCDYKVIVLTMDKRNTPVSLKNVLEKKKVALDDVDDYCKIWGCLNAMMKNVYGDNTISGPPMKSAVAFTSTISDSRLLTDEFKIVSDIPNCPTKIESNHIDGTMDAAKRDQLLTWLRNADEVPRVLSNVRCLSEGVDVPALDAVIFFSSKSSMIDIIQSVGRVMRKAPGKEYGYIIIPIVIDSDDSPEEVLDNNEQYKQVWTVLRALRAHDERLVNEINTFMFNKSKRPKHIGGGGGWEPYPEDPYRTDDWENGDSGWNTTLDGYIEAFYGMLVTKVGEKDYIENWATEMGKIAPTLRKCLEDVCMPDGDSSPAFDEYLQSIRSVVNSDVTEKDAIDMLMQQYVTKPIFNKLFGDNDAVSKNSVFNSIERMMRKIDVEGGLSSIHDEMEEFYRNVSDTLGYIDTAEGKQKTIKALYEKFFKKAFGKEQEKNGIVYTPGEIVDFILRSVDDVLRSEFGKELTSPGVNILDPFTGTGTFIAHLIGSGLIRKEDLQRKYEKELFANEITLIAYYIATVNIENAFAMAMGQETGPSFENILLTDTFNIENLARSTASLQSTLEGDVPFGKNRRRIKREHEKAITVIVGNPPYGANQKKANDNAKKRKYNEKLVIDGTEVVSVDQRIRDSYLNDAFFTEGKGLVNAVYDNYIRAYRWSTDRLRGGDGVIAFVTPNGWLTGSAFIGFRKVIEKDFDSIYIYNLRGDQNSGDWKNEGEKVFGGGSKVGICVMMLIRHRGHSGKAKIHYIQTPDQMKRIAKLESLNEYNSFIKMRDKMTVITPQENGDWIVKRNSAYKTLTPIAGDTRAKFEKHSEKTIFVGYTSGYKTNRDSWAYNSSEKQEKDSAKRMVEEYNRQVSNETIERDSHKLSWDGTLESCFTKKVKGIYNEQSVELANYRPFFKKWLFNNRMFINSVYQMSRIYSTNQNNLTICVSGVGVKKDFSCLMTNTHTDLEIVGKSQCFPLYWYEIDIGRESKQSSIADFGISVDSKGIIRHDGISDWALEQAKSKYGIDVTKEDIFYYVYGYLHSKDYRDAFSEDLKMELPRIGFVKSYDDFRTFSEAGRKLADLHLNYESVPAWKGLVVNKNTPAESFSAPDDVFKVGSKKMKIDQEKGTIQYNESIIIGNIPEEAFRYVVNGRSALGWIAEMYRVTVDKDTGIINDPNEYSGGKYIFDLILSIVTVSMETVRIVDSLPKLDFNSDNKQE